MRFAKFNGKRLQSHATEAATSLQDCKSAVMARSQEMEGAKPGVSCDRGGMSIDSATGVVVGGIRQLILDPSLSL